MFYLCTSDSTSSSNDHWMLVVASCKTCGAQLQKDFLQSLVQKKDFHPERIEKNL